MQIVTQFARRIDIARAGTRDIAIAVCPTVRAAKIIPAVAGVALESRKSDFRRSPPFSRRQRPSRLVP